MLYKKNHTPELDLNFFKNPTSEYRGTPFWSWNGHLERDELLRQIDVFKEMGLGGFHMHVRTGLEDTYLSDKFMDNIRSCVEKAENEQMLAWLYDEDRWPSGAAGGYVTKDHAMRERFIKFSPDYDKTVSDYKSDFPNAQENDIRYLTCYDIVVDEKGYLVSFKQIDKDDDAQGNKWYLFLCVSPDNSWYNNQAYIDTLNPEAVKKFVEVTHEKYYSVIGDKFDKSVPAIFTDEPQVHRKQHLGNSFDTSCEIEMPWTEKLPEIYRERYGVDIFEHLPEIIWQLPESASSPHRYYYHDLVADLFANSFCKTIGDWCAGHNLAFTGHLMEEPSLESQTHSVGEAMRSYGNFGIPGIDMLCNFTELTTAKQCQSAVHQYGKEGMLSELYGVTSWDCDFMTYKYSGDWQAALGVTVRVPHLSWYTMKGEAKRDYPASISFQSPWYKKYPVIEDHFARLNTALTRGKPIVKVGVIHPVESFWINYGPDDLTGDKRAMLEERFFGVVDMLLESSIDFDFISESLLPSLCKGADKTLKVGEMEYEAAIVPGCETLRSTTVDILSSFVNAGGRLIFMGEAPEYVDAVPDDRASKLFELNGKKGGNIPFERYSLICALEDFRVLSIKRHNSLCRDYIYQLRSDNGRFYLFICRRREPEEKHSEEYNDIKISAKGNFKASIMDTLSGEIVPADVSYFGGETVISRRFYGYDSLLLCLEPGAEESRGLPYPPDMTDAEYIKNCESYSLDEDNLLLLDMAEFSVDGSEFYPCEEILRLDNKVRDIIGIGQREGRDAQPWVYGNAPENNRVTLRYTFESEIDYSGASLALESPEKARICFNGISISSDTIGNFVDNSIFKVALPDIKKGVNILTVTYPFGEKTNLESVYILGKFGVRINGYKKTVTELPEKIDFGSLINQGFPFYSGNIRYKFKAVSSGGKLCLCVNHYAGSLVSVYVDGSYVGDIVYPPYILEIKCDDGEHTVELLLFNHRYNTFGPVHLDVENYNWHGPNAWRTQGDEWSYEYKLKNTGILTAPRIL